MAKFVVMCDAVVVTIGKKPNGKPEYTRVLRGGIINGKPESPTIADFLRRGAIKQAHTAAEAEELRKPEHRQTVKQAAALTGAPDDPVAAAFEGILPVAAPNPTLGPDAILPDDAEDNPDVLTEA